MSSLENGIPWWGRLLDQRVKRIEDLEPAVQAQRLTDMADDVKALKRAFYTFAFSTVGAAIVFAFTVFALLGRHP